MRTLTGVILLIGFLWSAAACAEELSVPVEYHGQQIQLTGRFEKGAVQGQLPVVILLHNCAGMDGSPSLAVWAPLMWAQGYATLRLDSFTARGYHNVCSDTGQVRPSERAQDDGAPLIAFRQNRAEIEDAPSTPGTWLHASWPAESGHIVRDETAEPASA